MLARSIPLVLIAFACASATATGQQSTAGPRTYGQQDHLRMPSVIARVEDNTFAAYDPPPSPPTVVPASHATSASRTRQPVMEEMSLLPEPLPEGNCPQCGGTCRHTHQACRPCPPSRWNLFARVGHCWNTRTKPCLQASHWGYPEEFCERPFGSYVRANLCAQVANGLQDQLILYRYDFIDESLPDGYQLKPRGRYELAKIIALVHETPMLQGQFYAICVEETVDNPQLNDARRQHVLQQLELMQFPLPPDQVVIGRARTPGISGDESLRVYDNLTRLWETGNQGSGGNNQTGGAQLGGTGLGTGAAGGMGR